ncbi:unnamed protein product [Diamesa serratosioi]
MSSFVKIKKNDNLEIPGIRLSIRNCQIASTGNDSLDFVVGGGLEIGSVFLIGEDKFCRYSQVLTKYFLAEGIANNHKVFYCNFDENPRELIKDVPPPCEVKQEATNDTSNNDLRIAFRYQGLAKIDSVQKGIKAGLNYDLSKKYEKDQFENIQNVTYLSFDDFQQLRLENNQSAFDVLLSHILKLASQNSDNLLRICLSSIGSPLWYSDTFSKDFLRFLVQLKAIVRYNENVVCFLSIPLHLINLIDDQIIFKIRKIVDCNINLESFDDVDKQTNAFFKQYHGLIHIKKLQTLNSLQSHKPEEFDLAFKLKSNRFLIEKLHLPPELQDNDQTAQVNCGSSGGNSNLDF